MNGVYGTTVPSNVTSDMIDIYYAYHATRNSDSVRDAVFTKLPDNIITKSVFDALPGAGVLRTLQTAHVIPLEQEGHSGCEEIFILCLPAGHA